MGQEIIGNVLFWFGAAFWVFTMSCFGKGTPKASGTIYIFAALINLMNAAYIGYTKALGPGSVISATFVTLFSFTWLNSGLTSFLGLELVPHGNLCFYNGFVDMFFALYFFWIGWPVWGILTVSWAIAFWIGWLSIIGKVSIRAVGTIFGTEAWATLFIPACLLMLGIPIY